MGIADWDIQVSLADFNALPDAEARATLAMCCVSERWIDGHARRATLASSLRRAR
jgi:hypothetical protein